MTQGFRLEDFKQIGSLTSRSRCHPNAAEIVVVSRVVPQGFGFRLGRNFGPETALSVSDWCNFGHYWLAKVCYGRSFLTKGALATRDNKRMRR
jgi:hypothetical protein